MILCAANMVFLAYIRPNVYIYCAVKMPPKRCGAWISTRRPHCLTTVRKTFWHIPAEPGPGSGRPTGACWAVSPHSGKRSLVRRLIRPAGRLRASGSGRCGLVPEVGSGAGARLVFMGSIEVCENPGLEHDDRLRPNVAARLASGGHPVTG